jgi:hypothetical protein
MTSFGRLNYLAVFLPAEEIGFYRHITNKLDWMYASKSSTSIKYRMILNEAKREEQSVAYIKFQSRKHYYYENIIHVYCMQSARL